MVGMKKEERGGKKEDGMPGKQNPADVLTGSFSGNTGFNPNFSTKWVNVNKSSRWRSVRGISISC